jgi:hypothetical protein
MKNSWLCAVLLLMASQASAQPGHNGFNFPSWSTDGYASGGSQSSLSKLAKTGAGWVALTPTWYMKARTDSTLGRGSNTPSDDSVRAALRAAKGLGLRVALKPHVDIEGGGFRALISPGDAKAWFASYRLMLLRYAHMAKDEHADMLVVGTELFLMSSPLHYRQWESLIAEVRGIYSGPLTYAANWYDFAQVSFWGKLDFIGIDGYFPLLSGDNKLAMKLEWMALKPQIAAAAAVWGKPVLFTEFGISSQKGAERKPWEWREFGPVDLQVQKNYFESFIEVFGGESWFAGLWQWSWDTDATAGRPNDTSMDVLKNLFNRSPSPAPGLSPQQKENLNAAVRRALLLPLAF